MRKRTGIFWVILLATTVLWTGAAGILQAQLIQDYSTGKVDWEAGYVYGTAVGTANMKEMVNRVQAESVARKTARDLAYAALSETVNNIQVDSSSIYRLCLMKDSILETRTQGVLRDAHVFRDDFSWTSDEEPRAVVTVRLALNGGLSRLTAPYGERKAKENLMPTFEPPSPLPAVPEGDAAFTGLIIDASGIGALPAMNPRLLTADGKRELYGPGIADPAKARVQGFASYVQDLEQARSAGRAGANPLIVKAAGTGETMCGDLLVSEEDAVKVFAADSKGKFLEQCKVVIVLN